MSLATVKVRFKAVAIASVWIGRVNSRWKISGDTPMATNVIDTAFHPESSTSPARCVAHQLEGAQRQQLAIDVLAGNGSVTELAERHQVSRKFL